MDTLTGLVTAVSTWLQGNFGRSAVTLAIAAFAVMAIFTQRWDRVMWAILGGAIMFMASYIVTTWINA
jgi:type IV secretory pathway VirB2 component (pilin)